MESLSIGPPPAWSVTCAAGREEGSRPPFAFASCVEGTLRDNRSPTCLAPPGPGEPGRPAEPFALGLTSQRCPQVDQPDSPRMGGGGWGTHQRAEVQEAGRALPPEPRRRSQRAGETDSDLSRELSLRGQAATGQRSSGAAWEPPSATGAARGDSAWAPDSGDPRPSRSASGMRAAPVSAADGGGWRRPGRR